MLLGSNSRSAPRSEARSDACARLRRSDRRRAKSMRCSQSTAMVAPRDAMCVIVRSFRDLARTYSGIQHHGSDVGQWQFTPCKANIPSQSRNVQSGDRRGGARSQHERTPLSVLAEQLTPARSGAARRGLAHDLARWLVVAQPEEPGVPQPAGGRPLAEAELGHEFGAHPLRGRLADAGGVGERRRVLAQRAQALAERAQRLLVEAGADLAGVAQAVAVVVAEQQRPEVGTGALGRGEAADDQLLALLALELEPVLGALVGVRAVGALGDQALPPLAARLGEDRLAVAIALRREAHRPCLEAQRVAQQALAGAQRQRAHVLAVEPQ